MISNNIALIHEWLVTYGGSEAINAAFLDIWPDASVHTLVYDPNGPCKEFIQGHKVITSFIQNLPLAKRAYRSYLPIMPLAVEQFDLREYEIIISCSHAVAHGVLTRPDQLHINYICIPMRYAWHLYHDYLEQNNLTSGIKGLFAKLVLHYMRLWDISTVNRVDHYVAISQWVAQNVWRVYHRKADVIYPPVDLTRFELFEKKGDFYLAASRMVSYKKIDVIVEAFNKMPSKKLVIIGDGPEYEKIKANANSNIEFLGFQPFNTLKECMQKAKAFIYAAEEDFGIIPVEAQSCGTPVIAYKRGGILETVIEGKTGIFFEKQTGESIIRAVYEFEAVQDSFEPRILRQHAEGFRKERFFTEFQSYVESKYEIFSSHRTIRS